MKRRVIRALCVVAIAALSLLCLFGCAFFGEPASTEDLLVRFAANPNNVNFVAEGDADLSLTLAGYRTSVPITGRVEAADGSAHALVDVDLTSFADKNRTYEIYVEMQGNKIEGFVQSTPTGSRKWCKAEVGLSFVVDIPAIVEILSDARFMRASYESDDQVRYDLTLPATSVADAIFGHGDVTTTFHEVNRDELREMLGDSKLHVCFNKDCLVRSVSLELSYVDEDEEKLPRPLLVNLDAKVVLDDYGTVDGNVVAVPDAVRNAARDTDDPFDINGLADELVASVG